MHGTMKITIEGPQGCGKTTVANMIATGLNRNKKTKALLEKGRSFLVCVREDGKFDKRDRGVYDVVIVTKLGK